MTIEDQGPEWPNRQRGDELTGSQRATASGWQLNQMQQSNQQSDISGIAGDEGQTSNVRGESERNSTPHNVRNRDREFTARQNDETRRSTINWGTNNVVNARSLRREFPPNSRPANGQMPPRESSSTGTQFSANRNSLSPTPQQPEMQTYVIGHQCPPHDSRRRDRSFKELTDAVQTFVPIFNGGKLNSEPGSTATKLERFLRACQRLHNKATPTEQIELAALFETRVQGEAYDKISTTRIDTLNDLRNALTRAFTPKQKFMEIAQELKNCCQ